MSTTRHYASALRLCGARPSWSKACCLLLVVGAVAAGCRGSPGASAAAPSDAVPAVPWDDMTVQQKDAYMRSTVMPEMRAVFSKFDPVRYSRMGCTPCHARGRGSDKYWMPNEDLLLDPASCEEVPGSDPTMTRMNRFMDEQVGPAMSRLLGKPWNSCYLCHVYDQPR
ncbi:MAG: hypothetical protein ACHREM_08040 [Polyangiales bacterium]